MCRCQLAASSLTVGWLRAMAAAGYCSRSVTTVEGSSCSSLIEAEGTPPVLFYFLNSWAAAYYCDLNPRPVGQQFCFLNRRGCGKVHAVVALDTCGSIMAAYGLGQQMFDELNPSLDCGDLLEGQLICILPGESTDCP